jgi:hypothetical protein
MSSADRVTQVRPVFEEEAASLRWPKPQISRNEADPVESSYYPVFMDVMTALKKDPITAVEIEKTEGYDLSPENVQRGVRELAKRLNDNGLIDFGIQTLLIQPSKENKLETPTLFIKKLVRH